MSKKLVKYMGTSHVFRLETGEDFGGQLKEPLAEGLEWNLQNNHVVEVDLPKAALELLLEEPGLIDVTDMDRIPRSAAQDIYQPVAGENPVAHSPAGVAEQPSSSATGDAGTTVGGSTAGGEGGGKGGPGGSTRGAGS